MHRQVNPMNLQTFFTEKDFDIQVYDVEVDGTFVIITTDVVIEAILRTTGNERRGIENILLQLDFKNGDFHHFFRHLATGLAAQHAEVFA
jgi:hypothetical protein